METIDVTFSIRRHLDRADGGDSGEIDRNNLLADCFLSRSKIQLVNLGRHFPRAIEIDGSSVQAPNDRYVSRLHSIYHARLASVGRVKVSFFIRTNSHNRLAVGRNRECGCIDSFGGDRFRDPSGKILYIETYAVLWFVTRKDKMLAIRKPTCPLVVDRIIG